MPQFAIFLLLFLAAPLAAAPKQVRTPDQVEKLYKDLGSQMTCTCGCREGLLDCSHNNCPAKPDEQRFLRGLCEDASKDAAAIRAAMATRFGQGVLQAPGQSLLYPLLIVGGLAVLAVFGALVWLVAGRGKGGPPAQAVAPASAEGDPALDARIEREINELE